MSEGVPHPEGTKAEAHAQRRVSVLGAGVWGAVLATHLARQGHRVTAWDLFPAAVQRLRETGGHPKLPGFRFAPEIELTDSLATAVRDAEPECVVLTTATAGFRQVVEACKALGAACGETEATWVLCGKGIEEASLKTMSGILEEIAGPKAEKNLAVLSGPSFAAEVGVEKPTTVCVAAHVPATARFVQDLFMTDAFRVYTQDDVEGVELGGAMKNVIAIAAGACDGMDLGLGARASLITRGLAEMIRLGVRLGARPETFAGLAGMGDLILTCSGTLSRNHQFGELLAQGVGTKEALEEIGMVVEGMATARSVNALADRHGVEMPIAREVYRVIYEGKHPAQALRDLMRRDPKSERE